MGSEPAGARGRNNHLRMWITRHPIAYLTIGARVKSVQSDGTVGSGVRRYRLNRVRSRLQHLDYAGVILYDPVHIRNASDTTNMSVWTSHNPYRYLWVGAEGPTILFDYKRADFLAGHSSVVDEVRPATLWMYAPSGTRMDPNLALSSAELAGLVDEHGGGNRRLAIDRASPDAIHALGNHGLQLRNGDEVMELSRSIKSPEEITLMKAVMVATEPALDAMRSALEPGMTELDLWAVLHAENIVRGGEWDRDPLLCSGPRTNPWYQEASARVIENGDLVAFDTDLIGAFGVCIDVSRTWIAGTRRPDANQRDIFGRAEEVQHRHRSARYHLPGADFRLTPPRHRAVQPLLASIPRRGYGRRRGR